MIAPDRHFQHGQPLSCLRRERRQSHTMSVPFALICGILAALWSAFYYWYWRSSDRTGRGQSYRATARLTFLIMVPASALLLVVGTVQMVLR